MNAIFFACVLRLVSGQWACLDDAGHKPLWVKSVVSDSESVTLIYERPVSRVLAFHVSPDETFARRGVTVGASVGFSQAVIWFGPGKIRPADLTDAGGNFWASGWFLP